MLRRKQPLAQDQKRKEIRKILHDLRASQHAIKLNAEAARLIAGKQTDESAAVLQQHLQHMRNDLDKFRQQLENLDDLLKSEI